VEISNTSKTFVQEGAPVYALHGIDLEIRVGETVALVGESGSGKSTLAKVLLGIHAPDDGAVIALSGKGLAAKVEKRTQGEIGAIQMVFQNPDSALNRRHSVRRIIGRAVRLLRREGRKQTDDRTKNLLSEVRMGSQHYLSKPRQLSGGLKQRVAIARAFAGTPALVICDEPTSALDVSVQAAIINLLAELQAEENVSYLFISHDLNVVRYIADRVAVMYLGKIVEKAPRDALYERPMHPYTHALMSAIPIPDPEKERSRHRIILEGDIPSPANPPTGCRFHTRCPIARAPGVCSEVEPPLEELEPGHFVACHFPEVKKLF
jgi:peptide/nickel transport system ATP-binding protein